MDWILVFNCMLILVARVCDVTLGTLRTVSVIYGRRYMAWFLGFFEVLVWVLVVGRVIPLAQEQPVYAVFYAAGFATGNFIGITIERSIAFGDQVVRVFTRLGPMMADALRAEEWGVTEFDGRGRDGPVMQLFIQTKRRRAPELVRRAREIDPSCYYVIDDVRTAGTASFTSQSPNSWRGIVTRR